MLTSERLLKIISILTVLITVGFSTVVVIKELMRPEKMFDRIVEKECRGNYVTEDEASSESDLKSSESSCILIKKAENSFLKLVDVLGRLEDHQYLYKGKKGVLLKKESTDFSKQAEYIHKCLRFPECNLDKLEDSKVSVTGLMYDRNGELVCSNTFFKTSISQIAKGLKRLFTEITKVRKKDIDKLALKLLFHHEYTFIEEKKPEFINRLLNNDTDGLYISSRGAKIRVLPLEYSGNAMNILGKKGRQYGLEKDEYKNELAKIYLFRTSQYFENGQKMIPWEGASAILKKDYSDNLAKIFLKKRLENVLTQKKRFPLERNFIDGAKEKKDASHFTQLSLAEAMIESSPEAFKIIRWLLKRNLSDLTSSYIFNIIKLSGRDADFSGDILKSFAAKFSDTEKVGSMIKKDPIYTGFFLESHLLSTENISSTEKLFNVAVNEFGKLENKDRIRFIIYLGKLTLKKNNDLFGKLSEFINRNSKLFQDVLWNSRGFSRTAGSISLNKSDKPDTALTLALASGLSELRKNHLLGSDLSEIESGLGNFIRFMIVTGDDFPRWNDPKVKAKVQGGVRSSVGSQKIKLSNSVRAYRYFSNRSKSESK